mmetsp:Transcript_11020/g.28656  ORF Transcript_11020/g.28656 Transcript_11020/m.28656 type:complete len:266 (-) Transcript_11020:222-1019(-)
MGVNDALHTTNGLRSSYSSGTASPGFCSHSCSTLRAWVAISAFGCRSSRRRENDAAALKLRILYATVIAERSERMACAGCIWQCVKYAESSAWRLGSVASLRANSIWMAVMYSLQIDCSSLSSATALRESTAHSVIACSTNRKWPRASTNLPPVVEVYPSLRRSTRVGSVMLSAGSVPPFRGAVPSRVSGVSTGGVETGPCLSACDAPASASAYGLSGAKLMMPSWRCSIAIPESNEPAAKWSAASGESRAQRSAADWPDVGAAK